MSIGDGDDRVDMVRHYDKCIQFDRRKFAGNLTPPSLNHLPGIIQLHYLVHYSAEEIHSILSADGDEVGARRGVVIAAQANRSPIMFIGIESHQSASFPLPTLDSNAGQPRRVARTSARSLRCSM